jgi:hypothetical protein
MTETELNQRIKIEGAEDGTRKLNGLAGAADRLAKGFGAVGAWGGAVGGLAGIWQVGTAIQDTDRLYQAVGRVHAMTGMAASSAHSMFEMFESSGIGQEAAEKTILSMSRLSAKLAMAGTQSQTLSQLMTRLGVSVKAGPEQRLYQMADAAKAGRLHIHDLIKSFNIPATQAGQMMEMLQGGAERLRKIKTETLGGANLIDGRALAMHKEMLAVRRGLASAWSSMIGTLYKNLMPAVTMILNEITSAFKAIEPITASIGRFLAEHMGIVVGLAKTYLALMLAAKAANVFMPGGSMGLLDRGKQVIGGANRMMAGKAAASGGMDYFAAKAANPGIGMFASAGGPMMRILSTVVGRLGVIGLVISIVIAAFELLRRNVFGIRDMFVSVLGPLIEKMKNIAMMVFGVLGKLFEAIKPILAILGGALLVTLLMFAWWMDKLMWVVEKVMIGLVALLNGVIWAINQIPGLKIDYIDMGGGTKAKVAGSGKDPEGKPAAAVYQDFRGSSFDINNNFPEGIDGGRVAVAFGDELAALGERRLDSGLRPLYSMR